MHFESIIFNGISIIVFFILARILNQVVMHSSLKDLLIEKDNFAVGIQLSGYLLGVIMIITAVLTGPGHGSLMENIVWVAIYGVIGLIYMVFIAEFGVRIFIKGDILTAIKRGNVAAGIVLAGCYVSTAMILSGAISGEESSGGSFISSMIFLLAGLVSLVICTSLFRLLTAYKDSEEIMKGNTAAALSYAGQMIAVGLIIKASIDGVFIDYASSFAEFGLAMLLVLALYPIRQWILQGILLGGGFSFYGGRLDKEISEDRNMNVGLVEALTYILSAILASSFI
ncbi:MAG: DUF350 domain-containing protein [Candidatus Kapabacteria bacterium]|nr:DUF350 domain-containing protein [Candidatus Kapabacteria bacterium]